MTTGSVRRRPVTGPQLVVALAVIFAATAVLPPAAAWSLNEARIAQTEARVRSAADRLRTRANEISGFDASVGIACGPGRLPDLVPTTATARAVAASLSTHGAWLRRAGMAPELFGAGMPTDAWGRCFLLNVEAWSTGEPVWLLSAGPNGLVDTPADARTTGGDDVGVRVR
jgi:hypothetical protein